MKSVAGKGISSSSLLLRLLLMPSSWVTPLLSATLQSSCWKLLQAAVVQVSFPTRIDSSQIHNNPWRFLHLKWLDNWCWESFPGRSDGRQPSESSCPEEPYLLCIINCFSWTSLVSAKGAVMLICQCGYMSCLHQCYTHCNNAVSRNRPNTWIMLKDLMQELNLQLENAVMSMWIMSCLHLCCMHCNNTAIRNWPHTWIMLKDLMLRAQFAVGNGPRTSFMFKFSGTAKVLR